MYKVGANQNAVDLAVQLTGSAEGLVALMRANGKGLDWVPEPGEVLQVPDDIVIDADVVAYYQSRAMAVASGLDEVAEVPGGIGFWAIETEFAVM